MRRRSHAANGRKGGRPRKMDAAGAPKAHQLRDEGLAASDITSVLGVSRATVDRYRPGICVAVGMRSPDRPAARDADK